MKAHDPLKIIFVLLLASLAYFHGMVAQAVTLPPYHKSPVAPAFEKIYIDPLNLIYMPNGLYYCEEDGILAKVDTVLQDCYGTYVLHIDYQCPLCGRVYTTKEPDDDHGCPLFMHQVHPEIWEK